MKIFTLMADTAGRFDESELEAFCESNEILSVVEHFFEYAGTVRWALLLSYMDGKDSRQRSGFRRTGPTTPNLPPEQRSLYEVLRTWRAARAQDERIPAFQVFSNAELAEICRRQPTGLTQLAEIRGIGEAKKKRYGEDVVAMVGEYLAGRPGSAADVGEAAREESDGTE